MLKIVAAIAFFVVILLPVSNWLEKKRRKRVEEIFAGRQTLDERAFYEKYFQSSGVPAYVAMKIRGIMERALGEDLSRLSAEDDFRGNLKFFLDEDDWAGIDIVEEIEKEFGIRFNQSECERMLKVKDIVSLTWAKIRQKRDE